MGKAGVPVIRQDDYCRAMGDPAVLQAPSPFLTGLGSAYRYRAYASQIKYTTQGVVNA